MAWPGLSGLANWYPIFARETARKFAKANFRKIFALRKFCFAFSREARKTAARAGYASACGARVFAREASEIPALYGRFARSASYARSRSERSQALLARPAIRLDREPLFGLERARNRARQRAKRAESGLTRTSLKLPASLARLACAGRTSEDRPR